MLKAVIFDMDGVLIDSEPHHLKLEQEIFKDLGIDVNEIEHQSFIGTTSYFMWESLKNKYNLLQTVEELVRQDRSTYLKYLKKESIGKKIFPIEGVTEFIKDLHKHGLKLAVASSSPFDIIETVIKSLGLENYFDLLVTGDSVGKSKPEPDIFLYTAEKLKIEPNECFVIEDSANGVRAAKGASMFCLGYKNINSGNQDLSPADMVIESFLDIDFNKLEELYVKSNKH